jgi:hypothetical protein
MSRFVLLLESENRFITNVEVIAAMSLSSGQACGLVYAEGIDGDRFRVRIDAFNDSVRFFDELSALNAIEHLKKDIPREASEFRVVCCE